MRSVPQTERRQTEQIGGRLLRRDPPLKHEPWLMSAEPEGAFDVVIVVAVAISVGGGELVSVAGQNLDGADFRRRFGFW